MILNIEYYIAEIEEKYVLHIYTYIYDTELKIWAEKGFCHLDNKVQTFSLSVSKIFHGSILKRSTIQHNNIYTKFQKYEWRDFTVNCTC